MAKKTKEKMFIHITSWCNFLEGRALDMLFSDDADEDIKERFEKFEKAFSEFPGELIGDYCPKGFHDENGVCVPD